MKRKKLLKIAIASIIPIVALVIVVQMLVRESFLLVDNNFDGNADVTGALALPAVYGCDDESEAKENNGYAARSNTTEAIQLKVDVNNEERTINFKLNKPIIKTENGQFSLNAVDLIREAVKVLPAKYDDDNEYSYDKSTLNAFKANGIDENGYIRNTSTQLKLDCTGLIQWAIGANYGDFFKYITDKNGKLKKESLIRGFWREGSFGIPRSVDDWTSKSKGGKQTPWFEIGRWDLYNEKTDKVRDTALYLYTMNSNPEDSIRNSTLTYDGKDINVLKINDPITKDFRYWEYYDSNQQKQELPMGTIIVSPSRRTINTGKAGHAWIYIGDLGTSNPKDARTKLARLLNIDEDEICSEEEIEKYFIKSGEGTHWLIESSGSSVAHTVTITNKDPDTEYSEGKKEIGPIWAFQVANDTRIPARYDIKVDKRSEDINQQLTIEEKTVKRMKLVLMKHI